MIVNVRHLYLLLLHEKLNVVGKSCLQRMCNTYRKMGMKIGSTVIAHFKKEEGWVFFE